MSATVVKDKSSIKKPPSKNSGRSISQSLPKGKRRVQEGKELAPRSLRKKGKKFLSECTEEELKKIDLL